MVVTFCGRGIGLYTGWYVWVGGLLNAACHVGLDESGASGGRDGMLGRELVFVGGNSLRFRGEELWR